MISLIVTGPICGEPLAAPVPVRNVATSGGLSWPNVCADCGQNSAPPSVLFKPVAVTRPNDVLVGCAPQLTMAPAPVRLPGRSTAEGSASPPVVLKANGTAPDAKSAP